MSSRRTNVAADSGRRFANARRLPLAAELGVMRRGVKNKVKIKVGIEVSIRKEKKSNGRRERRLLKRNGC